jgi:hypothetical protein
MASNIKLINLASYTSPKISESPRLSWVEYGDDNNYFEYLIDRFNGSPTNNAVIAGVVDMIYGKGVNATNAADNAAGFMELRRLITPEQLKRVVNDFYMLGNAAFQVVYTADKSKIAEVYHMPVETLRAEKCNDEGEIEAYYYAYDWSKVRNKSQAERIPAFGYGAAGEKIEILYIRPYRSGSYYYSPVDYQGGLPYAELEEEIANYHINNIKNGLAPSMIINFNNGIPPQEEQDNIDFAIRQKWSGTNNAGKYILAFNDDSQKAATIEPVTLSEAHLQYEFLSRESSQKIMVAHRVTSPMLFGIKDNTGLGSNADEIKNSFQLMDNVVVRPKQEEILKGIDKLLAYNKVNLDLYFETLTPIEFTDIDVVDAATVQEETGVDVAEAVTPQAQEELIQKEASYNGAQIASSLDIMRAVQEGVLSQDQAITFLVQMLQFDPQVARALFAGNSSSVITQMKSQKGGGDSRPFLKEELAAEIVAKLQEIGESEEDLLKEFELVDAELVDDEEAEYDVESYLNSRIELAAQDKSEQDTERYKVRYFYAIGTPPSLRPKGSSRPLCTSLMSAGRVYRKEDIEALSSNGGAEAQGKPYSVWLYKGGANCYHRWERRVYRKKLTKDGKVWGGGTLNGTDIINVNEAVRQGFKLPKNAKEVAIAPIESDYSGYTADYARKHGIPK